MCLITDDHPKASSVQELSVQIYVPCGVASEDQPGACTYALRVYCYLPTNSALV